MAEDKKPDVPDVIELVAIERGFILGRMVEPGKTFRFRTKDSAGNPRKLPKWAQPAGQPLPKRVTAKNGDLKPKDAQEAVKAKAGALTGNTPPLDTPA